MVVVDVVVLVLVVDVVEVVLVVDVVLVVEVVLAGVVVVVVVVGAVVVVLGGGRRRVRPHASGARAAKTPKKVANAMSVTTAVRR